MKDASEPFTVFKTGLARADPIEPDNPTALALALAPCKGFRKPRRAHRANQTYGPSGVCFLKLRPPVTKFKNLNANLPRRTLLFTRQNWNAKPGSSVGSKTLRAPG